MAEQLHTPGPWTTSEHTSDYGVWVYGPVGPNKPRIAQVRFGLRCMEDSQIVSAEKANARLIAAAPELLEAAKWAEAALAPFSKDPAEKSGINLLRAAIAKATGGSV